jgi:hypothetical protein
MSNRDSPSAVATRLGSGFKWMPTPPNPLVHHIHWRTISGEEIDSNDSGRMNDNLNTP